MRDPHGKRNTRNSFRILFLLEDITEYVQQAFYQGQDPAALATDFLRGVLPDKLQSDAKVLVEYLEHLGDWAKEEIQLANLAHKPEEGYEVVNHIEREPLGSTQRQENLYSAAMNFVEKEAAKKRGRKAASGAPVRGGKRGGRTAPRGGGRGGPKPLYKCSNCLRAGHTSSHCRDPRKGPKGGGGGSDAGVTAS